MVACLGSRGVAMDIPERGTTGNRDLIRSVSTSSLPDSRLGSSRELDALFDQSPIAMVFNDRELRTRRTNAAFRRLAGLPDEALIGRRPTEVDLGTDAAWGERILAEQVISRGVPIIDVHVEQTLTGKRQVLPRSASPLTDNGHALGPTHPLRTITHQMP